MSKKSRGKSPVGKVILVILLIVAVGYVMNTKNKEQSQAAAKPPPAKTAPATLRFTDKPHIVKLTHPLADVVNKQNGRTTIDPKGITLHWWSLDSGGNIQGLVGALRTNRACGNKGCSVQFGITKNGVIYQMMRSPNSFAQHAHGANNTTIGIEIEGSNKDFAPPGHKGFDQKRFVAAVSLVTMLMKEYKIPLNGKVTCDNVVGVHGHHEYNKCGNDKDDTGPAYTKAVKDAVKSMQR